MTTTTKTPTLDERIAQRRADLAKQRVERTDELDLPRTMTMRQVNAHLAETARIDREIATFTTIVKRYSALPSVEPDEKWRDFLVASRATLSAELLAIKSPIRDKALLELAQRLEWCIKLIDRGLGISTIGVIVTLAPTRIGALMAAAGYAVEGAGLRGPNGFRGSLPETEQRIKELTKQRAAAQAALDLALEDDEQRAQRAADSQQYRDTLTRLHLRGNSDGTGFDVTNEDGDVRDLATLAPVERAAFDRFCDGERRERQATIDRQRAGLSS